MENVEKNSSLDSIKGADIDFRRLIAITLDNKHIIALFFSLSILLGLVYISLATPLYKANSIIIVEDNAPGIPGIDDVVEVFSSESSSATELQVINSRLVVGRVVDELNLSIDIEPKSNFGIDNIFASDNEDLSRNFNTPNIKYFNVPKNMIGTPFEIQLENQQQYSLWFNGKKILTSFIGELAQSEDETIEIELINFDSTVGSRYRIIKNDRLESILNIQEELEVIERGKDTGIIEISLEGTNAEKITEIVNSISANYVLQNIQRMAQEAKNSLDFLDEQIPNVQQKLTESEDALNAYRSDKGSVDLSLEAESILESLVKIESDISAMSINEADISRRFTPQHPSYISFKRQQANLFDQREKLNMKLESLPDTQKRILQLQREFNVNQGIFIALENKRQELSILKASTVGNVRILDTAEALPEPVAPRKALTIFLSGFLGLILGFVYVLVKQYFNMGIKDPSLFADLNLMVLGVVPESDVELDHFKRDKIRVNKEFLLALNHPEDLSIEACRSLRTALHFALLESNTNSIMVSSANPGVGKSFIVSNLCAVIAQTGQKVLIIDADLRRGKIKTRMGLKKNSGLSDVLSGTVSAESAIEKSKIANMDVLARGSVPTNPSELLMSENFKNLLQSMKDKYDYVIVDTPPILAVTDAAIIGRYCGISIMVSRFDSCTFKQMKESKIRFNQNGINISGVVLNAIKKRESSYYYDYGYYEYDYRDSEPRKT